MKLYHISRSTEITNVFFPKQPELSLCIVENTVMPDRICVSSTIEGCFSAVYFGCNELKYSRWWNNLYDDTLEDTDNTELFPFKLYVFDTADIDVKYIKAPNEIFMLGVEDALLTNEHWILTEIKPNEVYELYVESFTHEINSYGKDKKLFTITSVVDSKKRII